MDVGAEIVRVEALVVGGGLAGLAAGLELEESGIDWRGLEGGGRLGGVVGSLALETEVGRFLFESGPNSVPAGAAQVRVTAERLGLLDQLVGSSAEARTRYLMHRGRLRALPASPPALLATPLLSMRSKWRVLTERWRTWTPPSGAEPTLAELLDERFGQEVTQRLAGAFVRGVYAGTPEGLGAKSAFPRMWALLEEHGSLLRGAGALARGRGGALEDAPGPKLQRGALLGFRGGFQTLIDGFTQRLGGRFELGARVRNIGLEDGRWHALTSRGERYSAQQLVLAVPARAAAQLLGGAGLDDLAQPLREIPHRGVVQVHLGWGPSVRPPLPEGFGFLVPPTESGHAAPGCLGAIFASNLFDDRAPSGGAAVTCFRSEDEAGSLDEQACVERSVADLGLALGATPGAPDVSAVVRWPGAIPQAGRGHAERMESLDAALGLRAPGLWCAGSYTGGVSVDDVLGRGAATARRALDRAL